MSNCIVCNEVLVKSNTPLFGKKKTKDLGELCLSCINKLTSKKPRVYKYLHEYDNEKILVFFRGIDVNKERRDENKKQEKQAQNNRLQEIRNTISKLNSSASFKREVSELPSILMSNEIIEKVDTGFLKEGKGTTGNGLLVATNFRLIFIDKPTLGFGIKMEDFPYDKITSVSVETGFLKGVIKIICSGNTAEINLVSGAKQLSEFVRGKTMTKPEAIQSPNNNVNERDTVIAQIEKLNDLREKGILTDVEFNTQKEKFLNLL